MYCYHWKLVVELHVRFTIRKVLALQIVLHIMGPHRMYCTDTGIPDVHLATQSQTNRLNPAQQSHPLFNATGTNRHDSGFLLHNPCIGLILAWHAIEFQSGMRLGIWNAKCTNSICEGNY